MLVFLLRCILVNRELVDYIYEYLMIENIEYVTKDCDTEICLYT